MVPGQIVWLRKRNETCSALVWRIFKENQQCRTRSILDVVVC
jgi:hypothetical protein